MSDSEKSNSGETPLLSQCDRCKQALEKDAEAERHGQRLCVQCAEKFDAGTILLKLNSVKQPVFVSHLLQLNRPDTFMVSKEVLEEAPPRNLRKVIADTTLLLLLTIIGIGELADSVPLFNHYF